MKNCTADFIGATLELIAEGMELIKYSEDGKAVMVIGLSGTGKSTFVYFFAGDESKLIAYSPSLDDFKIKDCNQKIGDGLASATIFPDLVQHPMSKISYYDNPGFGDNRSPCIEIANSYFMTSVTSKLSSVQFIITVSYKALADLDRTVIPKTLKSVLAFVPNIQKFKSSITLAATKLDKTTYEDERWVDETVKHLEKIKAEIGSLDLTEEEQENAKIMLDGIIESKSIVVFRTPNDCGPLNEIPLMVANKDSMTEILANVPFASCEETDFNLTLSGDTKNKVKDIAATVYPDIKTNLANLVFEISSTWARNLTAIRDIFDRQTAVSNFLTKATKIVSETSSAYNSSATFQPYFLKLRSILIDNVPSLEEQVVAFYDNYTTTVDFLEFLLHADAGIDWRIFEWNGLFGYLKGDLDAESNFVRIMIDLFGELSKVSVHYNDIGGYKEWYYTNRDPVSMDNLDTFWNKFEPILSGATSKEQLKVTLSVNSEAKFGTLNSLLGTTLATPYFRCGTVDTDGVVVYEDSYLNFANVFSTNCAHEELYIETVVVLAMHTAFIDRDVVGLDITEDDGINIVIISPRMIVEGKSASINLVGHSPESLDQIECCGGRDGEDGEDGYDGGDFYGFTSETSKNYVLNVDCSGGNGANGQRGQKGSPGAKGSTQTVRNYIQDDCAAWSGGDIQVRKYPNTCSPPGGSKCHADDDGRQVYVYGTQGHDGADGGLGGAPGSAGLSGGCQVSCLTCNSNSYTIVARNGSFGVRGLSGQNGDKGKCGDTMDYVIDDVNHNGGKYCEVLSSSQVEHRDGDPCASFILPNELPEGDISDKSVTRSNSNVTAMAVNIQEELIQRSESRKRRSLKDVDITKYKRRFEAKALSLYNNEFIGKRLQAFVDTL